jgi:hypothetical protein
VALTRTGRHWTHKADMSRARRRGRFKILRNMAKSPVDSDTAERLTLGTDELTVLATSAETGGASFAVMVRMPPGGGPPPYCIDTILARSTTSSTASSPFTPADLTHLRSGLLRAGDRLLLSRVEQLTRFATSRTPTRPPLWCTPLALQWRTSPGPRQPFLPITPRAWRPCWPSLNARALSCWDPYLSLSHGQRMAHISRRSRSQISCQD